MSGKATHGLSYTPEYRAWQTMRRRCTDPTDAAFADYGGRGIRVCAAWLNSPKRFVADMGAKPSLQHELDRRDNDGNYEPSNCRWVLRFVNCRNRRSNRRLVFRGETRTVAEWCELLGLRRDTVHHRLKSGWSVEDALNTATRAKSPRGHAKPALSATCGDCGRATRGSRCKSCENRRRWREKVYA